MSRQLSSSNKLFLQFSKRAKFHPFILSSIRLELRQVFNRDTQHVCGKTAMVNNTRGTRG